MISCSPFHALIMTAVAACPHYLHKEPAEDGNTQSLGANLFMVWLNNTLSLWFVHATMFNSHLDPVERA